MSNSIDNLDEVINKITQQVAARLKNMNFQTEENDKSTCDATDITCTSCGGCSHLKKESYNKIINLGVARLSSTPNSTINDKEKSLSKMIDHTLLKPDTTTKELMKVCEEARKYNFATVCVNSSNIPLVARQLKGTDVKAIAVVGFPLGSMTTQSKVFETREAVRNGAREIDMVINIGALKSKDYAIVQNDIEQVVKAASPHKVKVILETTKLTQEEKIISCALSKAAGAAFVKTSTGFGGGGANVEDVTLMRKIVGHNMEVKASGGVRTQEDAKAMISAGADRIGASASISIVTGKKAKAGNY